MCSRRIISSLLRLSCQPGSPASHRADAKCLVCTLVRHVFLAASFQVCSFPLSEHRAFGSPSHALGALLLFQVFQKNGRHIGVSNTGGQEEPPDLGCCLLDTVDLWVDMEVWGSLVEVNFLLAESSSIKNKLVNIFNEVLK